MCCAIRTPQVSPMMDRDLIILCHMQMGYIEFVVAPLIIRKSH